MTQSWHRTRNENLKRKQMTSNYFSDYPNSEFGGMDDHPTNYSHGGGRKPFSPIAEVEEEDMYTEDRSKHKDIGRKKSSSPKNSSSPKQPSLSPQSHSSSGSGHSSPRSPPTHTHPPPPTSQPPPLPPSAQLRSSSLTSTSSKSHSGVGGHSSKPGFGMEHTLHGMMSYKHGFSHLSSPSHESPHHNDHQSRGSSSSYSHVQRVGGVGKSHQSPQHGSDSHVPYSMQDVGNRVSKHSSKQQQQHQDGNYNTTGMVNSRVVPAKMFPAVSEFEHSDGIHAHAEQLIDPGDRGSPSGASSPSTTPNNTLGKAAHHLAQESLQSSNSDTKLTLGIIRRDQDTEQQHMSSSSSTSLQEGLKNETRGASGTTVHFGNVSFSVHNSRHYGNPSMVSKASSGSGGGRVLVQPTRSSGSNVGVRVAQFNQNGNHSFGEPQHSEKQSHHHHHQHQHQGSRRDTSHMYKGGSATSPDGGGVEKSSSSKGVKTPSPKTVRSPETVQHQHSAEVMEKVEEEENEVNNADETAAATAHEGSPTSSSEELTSINVEDDVNETDSAPKDHSHAILVPEATHPSTKQQQQQQHSGSGYLPRRTHGNASHIYPSHMHPSEPLPPAYQHMYTSLSQGGTPHVPPPPQGLPPNMQQPSLSQGHPPYSYDPGLYNHPPNMYANRPGAYESGSRPRHLSPPHMNQQYDHQPPYSSGASQPPQQKHQSGGYRQEHHHQHRAHPAAMQFMGGGREYGMMQPAGSKLPRPDHHHHVKQNVASIAVAHEAAGNGDVGKLRHMISNHEITDVFVFNEHKFSLAHKAALHGSLSVLKFLVKEAGLPPSALQLPDDSFTTPAMLAIQGSHLDCLQWLIEECKVPLEVRDTGGETLMHHAAFHGQVKMLEWLLTTIPKEEKKEILDECGVTPAHFAAQGGHLECLQLLIDRGYSVINSDKDNQRPVDWADAMGQHICVRYLSWYEACWTFSNEITQLQRDNDQLRETLALREREHQLTISKLQQAHEEKVKKIRDQYVDLTASILKLKDRDRDSGSSGVVGSGPGGAGAGGTTSGGSTSSKSSKIQTPVRKAPSEPPSSSQRRSRPPVHPDASKKRSLKSSPAHESKKDRGGGAYEDSQDQHDLGIDRRMSTPQEVLEKTMTSVAQRMNASREARKRQGGHAPHVPRTFSPLTPVIQRMYSNPDEQEQSKGPERTPRSQRSTDSYSEKRSAPKVKFSTTVTEFGGGSPAHSSSTHHSSSHKDMMNPDHSITDGETMTTHLKSDGRKGSS